MFRWVEHTAELELEIEAPSQEAVFGEALAAFAELAGDDAGSRAVRDVTLAADDLPLLLADWLDELVYLAETEGFVPERITTLDLAGNNLEATVEGHVGAPRHLVKAVTLHRLGFGRDGDGPWRARVVLDV